MVSDPAMLAVYGTLAPGEASHWVVRPIPGKWISGTARGYAFEVTWGPAEGYPGFIADSTGSDVPVSVLESDNLDRHWREIDDFQGQGYARQVLPVTLDEGGVIDCWIYVTLTDTDD